MKRFNQELSTIETRLFHPAGLYITAPRRTAFQFLEVNASVDTSYTSNSL